MSRRHAWLTFTTEGMPLPYSPAMVAAEGDGPGSFAVAWQRRLQELHGRWYDVVAPPQVAVVFVLQYLLQVPAHVAAHGAASGPWRADLDGLTFDLAPSLVPATVRLSGFQPDAGSLPERLDRAERDYSGVAEPLTSAYPAQVRLGRHVRSALVDDMWAAARREAEGAAGLLRPGVAARASCCLIYALPGCVECAGCPRLRPSGR